VSFGELEVGIVAGPSGVEPETPGWLPACGKSFTDPRLRQGSGSPVLYLFRTLMDLAELRAHEEGKTIGSQ